ncbi:MAG: VWA domain-containing protein, partial [Chloroflexota bacterium]
MKADFALDYDVLTVERPQKLYLMARLVSNATPTNQTRRPLNISLVLDRSGSMAGNKLEYTRQAAQFLVQHLSANDTLSIVLYNEQVTTLIPPESVSQKDAISQRLNQIKDRLASPELLSNAGLGNEIGFYIFDYPPERE